MRLYFSFKDDILSDMFSNVGSYPSILNYIYGECSDTLLVSSNTLRGWGCLLELWMVVDGGILLVRFRIEYISC